MTGKGLPQKERKRERVTCGDCGQGNPLSPTIFNVVVDAVVRQWLPLATQEAERRGGRGRERRHQSALFYADDGMIASTDPRWLQWAFTILVGLFD